MLCAAQPLLFDYRLTIAIEGPRLVGKSSLLQQLLTGSYRVTEKIGFEIVIAHKRVDTLSILFAFVTDM